MKLWISVLAVCFCFGTAQAQQNEERRQRQEARQEQAGERQARRHAQTGAQELQQASKYKGAHLHMENTTYNFGDIERRGGDLTRDFRLVNDGSTPLVITRVVTSCSCLKASFPKRPVQPGSTTVIRITYEPHKSEPGVFHKVIQVYSNSVEGRHIITVQGNSLDPNKM